ncbi:F-box protein [Prunus yedoensis var. nudiflora]|uniref:F-box protein n=1 Tax=Prunus yedoensis var. nudiflora TaxID=2094558 RepID=A0A314USF7_PRUYE|nr:F-box protein [Prunus yedoensis var. nudiflora]
MGRSRNRRQKQQNLVNLDWTELPRGILEIIFERLTVTDCVSVSGVCKAWRHVVAQELAGWQSRGVPWLMMCEKDREINAANIFASIRTYDAYEVKIDCHEVIMSEEQENSELGVAMRNRIYFPNDHAAPWWNEWDSNHLYGISARLNPNNAGRKDWGVFSLGNGTHEDFCFHGNRDRWGPIWLTCPQ